MTCLVCGGASSSDSMSMLNTVNNEYVNKDVVIRYFNGLHPSKQMFILNYDARKNHMDSKKIAHETIIADGVGSTDGVISSENSTA